MRTLALAVATAAGAGLLPAAPGTWGSALALPVFLGLERLGPGLFGLTWLALVALGVWAAEVTEQIWGLQDDGRIVIDEVAGQILALAPMLTLAPGSGWLARGGALVTGFVAFRLFDIAKPGPVRWAERRFEGGVGVMADDLVAGALAAPFVAGWLWLAAGWAVSGGSA